MFGVVPKTLWEKRAPADERNRITLAMRPLLVRGDAARCSSTPASATRWTRRASTSTASIGRATSITAGRGRASRRRHRHRARHRTCTSITPAASPTRDAAGRVRPRFPRAQYVVGRGEWEDATHPHERNRASYLAGELRAARRGRRAGARRRRRDDHAGRARAADRRPHACTIRSCMIESGGRTAVFAADLIPTTAHVDEPWIMGYDLYPMDTLGVQARVRPRGDRARVPDLLRARSRRSPPATSARQDGRKYVEPVKS